MGWCMGGDIAAVSCSLNTPRFIWGGILVLVDEQARPCMASVHGILGWGSWAVHGAWHRCMAVHGIMHGRCAKWGLGKNPNPAPAKPRGSQTT